MTGYAFISLGLQDVATTPLCAEDPNNTTNTRPITAPPIGVCEADGATCPHTGQTIWNDKATLCISGTIPKITTPPELLLLTINPTGASDWREHQRPAG